MINQSNARGICPVLPQRCDLGSGAYDDLASYIADACLGVELNGFSEGRFHV